MSWVSSNRSLSSTWPPPSRSAILVYRAPVLISVISDYWQPPRMCSAILIYWRYCSDPQSFFTGELLRSYVSVYWAPPLFHHLGLLDLFIRFAILVYRKPLLGSAILFYWTPLLRSVTLDYWLPLLRPAILIYWTPVLRSAIWTSRFTDWSSNSRCPNPWTANDLSPNMTEVRMRQSPNDNCPNRTEV